MLDMFMSFLQDWMKEIMHTHLACTVDRYRF